MYYQFTYEVNKLKGTSAQSITNQYSPRWPYYGLISSDSPDKGLKYADIYDFLEGFGALKWEQDPYDNTAFDYSMPWPTNTSYVKEALLVRLETWETLEISNEGTVITSNTDSDLYAVKSALNSGKVLTVGLFNSDGYSNINDPNRSRTIFYRYGTSGASSMGHAVTIVGYDDNVTFDIDGDGIIETGERGAFKIADSSGPNYADNGYFWIMYDALNGVSAVNGAWDDLSTRTAAFENHDDDFLGQGNGHNLFTYITVEEKNPLLLAEISLNEHDRSEISIRILSKLSHMIFANENLLPYYYQDYAVEENRILYGDYSDMFTSFDTVLNERYWGISLTCVNEKYQNVISSFKLTDYKGNIIETMNFESYIYPSATYSCTTNFEYGDVDYDGVLTSADVTKVMQVILNYSTISSLQKLLADYNQDGAVNLLDVTALMNVVE